MSIALDLPMITDASGKPVSVIVPLEIWNEIVSERETAYLLNSPTMRQRLLAAHARTEGIGLEEVRKNLGL